MDQKPQSLILIKNIKERPQPLSGWSAHNPRDIRILQRHSEPRSERGAGLRRRRGGGTLRSERSTESLGLALLTSATLVGGEGTGRRRVAAVVPEQQQKAVSLPATDGF